MENLTPSRPYLLRAFYEWLLDNELTPHLLVNASLPHTTVPQQYVKDGQIVLNIAPTAVVGLQMDNDAVSFSARFGGSPFQVYVPMAAVVSIQARENGAGTFFPPEVAYDAWLASLDAEGPKSIDSSTEPDDPTTPPSTPPKKGRPSLRVVK
ncbi:ClpXP protease specificity-enhancing factor [Oceanisphaera profunda]|uniref:ClpXP protease specificity-enhancing factor n=1 Tax=Oceanisphaera profunda TaxID=1416627 RepID=A0A1Y0D5P2_9GAMM|nr:ClpXP protease specificity-enhancing factor [Oceanisphaera profunda]ART82873.1 ClpXP protease specificity-enhancing factor [Oceanisphaera profunda]